MVSLWWIHIIHISPHILPLSWIGCVPRWHMGRACQQRSVGNTTILEKEPSIPNRTRGRMSSQSSVIVVVTQDEGFGAEVEGS